MKIQLICLGDELLNGKTQDQNAQWLAMFCRHTGMELIKTHVIPDDEALFKSSLKEALQWSQLIIISGGLGPTKDDLTKDFLAHFFQKELQQSDQAKHITLANYQTKNKMIDEKVLNSYSKIPLGFLALENEVGYAPGLCYTLTHAQLAPQTIIALPGVPMEFTNMCEKHLPALFGPKERNPAHTNISEHFVIRTWRIAERDLFENVAPTLWDELEKFGKVSSLPHSIGVDIGVYLKREEQAQLELDKQKIKAIIKDLGLSEYVWRFGEKSLAQTIIDQAKESRLKIGTAESCTGGLCASLLTDVPGSSEVFWGTIVSYSNEIKTQALGVRPETIEQYGAVSIQTAQEMAQGLRERFKLDFALSTSGIAGPGGGSKEKPVGLVAYAIAGPMGCHTQLHQFSLRPRKELKSAFAQMGLGLLNREIATFRGQ